MSSSTSPGGSFVNKIEPPAQKSLGLFGGPLWQLTLARWRTFYREPSAVFWTFGFPILLAVALGIAFRNRPPEPVSVCIESGPDTAAAEALNNALSHSDDIESWVLPPEAASAALRTGKADVVVVPGSAVPGSAVPGSAVPGSPLAGSPLAGSPLAGFPRVYRYDPTRPESRLARILVDDALQRAEGRRDPTATTDMTVTEPGSRYIDFLVPGLVGMGLMSSGLWGIGFVIVEMRTQKLVKRLLATPMRRTDFLLAFVVMRGLFLVFELPVLIGFGALAFSVPIRGSIALLFALGILGSLVFAGIGLLVASRAKNTQTVAGLINLVTMPMFLFSGVFFSAERFPEPMQPIIRALPLTALNDALRAVMLDGATFPAVARQTVILVAWGSVSFVLALLAFRWR
jgi:ABC-2 type transport system permease protein